MALNGILKLGSKGDNVKLLQQALNIKVDGNFGKATETAVKEFQKSRGLRSDGRVGPVTWEALGLNTPPFPPPTPKTPQIIDQGRFQETLNRQQNQRIINSQQIPGSVVTNNTPDQLKPKGKNKLGQRILNLSKQVFKLIIPKLQSLVIEYIPASALDRFNTVNNIVGVDNILTFESGSISEIKSLNDLTPFLSQSRSQVINNVNEQRSEFITGSIERGNEFIEDLKDNPFLEITRLLNQLPPTVLDQVKELYCPAPQVLDRLVITRNNIVGQLNSVGNKLDLLTNGIDRFTNITNDTQNLIDIAELAEAGLIVLIGQGVLPARALGPVVATSDRFEKLINNLEPQIKNINSALYDTSVPLGVASYTITQAIEILSSLDGLINLCLTEANRVQLTPVSNTIQKVTIRQVQSNIDSGSYNGFIIKIEEVPFSPTVTRRKAVAFNQSGIALLETPLSFTTNEQTLINELKLIIDRDNLRSY